MESDEIRSIVERARRAWMSGDATGFAMLFAPEGEFITPGRRRWGQPAIVEATAKFADTHSDVRIDVRRIIVEGDQAVVEWRWEDTDNATGAHHQADDAVVVDVKGGQIIRWREYIDSRPPE